MIASTATRTNPSCTITAAVGDLLQAVKPAAAIVAGVAKTSPYSPPIVAHLRMEADSLSQTVNITGTDLDTWWSTRIPCAGQDTTDHVFDVCIPSKSFTAAIASLSAFPDAQITLTAHTIPGDDFPSVTLRSDSMTLTWPGIEGRGFPLPPENQGNTTHAQVTPASGVRVAHCRAGGLSAHIATLRPHLAKVYLELHATGPEAWVATDGHRLAAVGPWQLTDVTPVGCIPATALQWLAKAFGSDTVDLSFSDTMDPVAVFSGGVGGHAITVTTRTRTDGRFPEFRRVIPDARTSPRYTGQWDVDPDALVAALKAVTTGAEKTSPVTLKTDPWRPGELRVECVDNSTVVRIIHGDHESSAPWVCHFDHRLLAEQLKACKGKKGRTVTAHHGDEYQPFVLHFDGMTQVLMPIRP